MNKINLISTVFPIQLLIGIGLFIIGFSSTKYDWVVYLGALVFGSTILWILLIRNEPSNEQKEKSV